MSFSGGCSCGAVRFTIDDYLYAQLCHCDACKKRTGSAYGVSVVIENSSLTAFSGETKIFTRTAESGNEVQYEFCPRCATTVRWRVAALKNRQVLAGGAFDSMGTFGIDGEMYTEPALPWARIGCDLVRAGAPDDAYRSALIEKARTRR